MQFHGDDAHLLNKALLLARAARRGAGRTVHAGREAGGGVGGRWRCATFRNARVRLRGERGQKGGDETGRHGDVLRWGMRAEGGGGGKMRRWEIEEEERGEVYSLCKRAVRVRRVQVYMCGNCDGTAYVGMYRRRYG